MNQLKEGQQMPLGWLERAIVHIYKNKGSPENCSSSYRPICLARIIYKIWSQLIAKKLAKILHIITNNKQYGYKEGISTIDAIIKTEDHIINKTHTSQIPLMDLSESFDTVNRPLMWAALYKKGLPEPPIKQIWRGHQNTKLMAKARNEYGKQY